VCLYDVDETLDNKSCHYSNFVGTKITFLAKGTNLVEIETRIFYQKTRNFYTGTKYFPQSNKTRTHTNLHFEVISLQNSKSINIEHFSFKERHFIITNIPNAPKKQTLDFGIKL